MNSSRVVTDGAGTVVYSVTHTPYGDTEREFVKSYDPKPKFSGKDREEYSKWDYFGARYYDHWMYRFTSVDPVINKEEALTNPQLWNLYSYCRNNPITYFDPDGRDIFKSIGNWWKNAPIRLFLKGDFKGGLRLLGNNLTSDLSDPSFVLGFVGGVKFKLFKGYLLINKKGILQWKDLQSGKFIKSPFRFPKGFKLKNGFGNPNNWESLSYDSFEEFNQFKDAFEFYKNAENSKAATGLLDAIEASIKNIKKDK